MARLKHMVRNVKTVLRQPTIALDYARWVLQSSFRADGPTRSICGARIGNFNGFSEYHSVVRGISAAELKFLRHHRFGSGAIIDVGANLGLFSLVIHDLLPGRRVIAFEPAPSTYMSLCKNVARNAASTIECHRLAISHRDGVESFVLREHARANSSLAARPSEASSNSIQVECTTLDRFVSEQQVGQIALLKVDVEGFEISVFQGAENVLSHLRPLVVYFEVCPALAHAAGFAADEAARFLEGKGYALHRIQDDGALRRVGAADVHKIALDNWVALDTK